jgi:hypothetical protein
METIGLILQSPWRWIGKWVIFTDAAAERRLNHSTPMYIRTGDTTMSWLPATQIYSGFFTCQFQIDKSYGIPRVSRGIIINFAHQENHKVDIGGHQRCSPNPALGWGCPLNPEVIIGGISGLRFNFFPWNLLKMFLNYSYSLGKTHFI